MYLVPVGDGKGLKLAVTGGHASYGHYYRALGLPGDLFAPFRGETRTKFFNHHQSEPQEEWTVFQGSKFQNFLLL